MHEHGESVLVYNSTRIELCEIRNQMLRDPRIARMVSILFSWIGKHDTA